MNVPILTGMLCVASAFGKLKRANVYLLHYYYYYYCCVPGMHTPFSIALRLALRYRVLYILPSDYDDTADGCLRDRESRRAETRREGVKGARFWSS